MSSYAASESKLAMQIAASLLVNQTEGLGGMKSRPPRAIDLDEPLAGDSSWV